MTIREQSKRATKKPGISDSEKLKQIVRYIEEDYNEINHEDKENIIAIINGEYRFDD